MFRRPNFHTIRNNVVTLKNMSPSDLATIYTGGCIVAGALINSGMEIHETGEYMNKRGHTKNRLWNLYKAGAEGAFMGAIYGVLFVPFSPILIPLSPLIAYHMFKS